MEIINIDLSWLESFVAKYKDLDDYENKCKEVEDYYKNLPALIKDCSHFVTSINKSM